MCLRFLRWVWDLFITGLLVISPIGLTLYVLWLFYRLVYRLIGPETAFARFLTRLLGHYIPGLELVVMFLVVLLVGFLSRIWFGHKLHQLFDRFFLSVPGVRKLYWAMKQLAYAVLRRNNQRAKFRRVVLFEYPKEGMYVLGFVTNEDTGRIDEMTGEECVSVYVPTAPNPLSGWVFFIPRSKIIGLDMSVDEGLSLILSGGIVFPESLKRGKDAHLEGREEKQA